MLFKSSNLLLTFLTVKMKQSIAPINSILEYKNHVIMAMGQTVRIDNTTFEFDRNIYSLKIIDNQLVAFGTKLLVIINIAELSIKHKESYMSVICDVKYENGIIFCLTMRGEVFGLSRNDSVYTKVLTARSSFSITAGKFFGNGFVGGTWNGNIIYNDNKYEIHAGTVYDMSYNNDYIISCSTDRCICVYNHEFTVKYRVYDYRTRIYKCGFIGCKAIVDKFVAWHNGKNDKTRTICVSDLFYYGITEKGKLKVFCNDDCVYELKSTSNRIICAAEIDNEFIVGYDNGEHEENKLHSIEQVSGSEREEILPYICSNNKYRALQTISEHINKIKAIDNTIYASVKNILYEYLDNKLEYVNTFSSYIIEIYENVIVTVEDTIVTADRHKEIVYTYSFRNITTAYKTFIGTRKGLLIYKDIAIAISNDAISGILEYRNDLYMSCKDGNMYMLSDIDKLCKTYEYAVEQQVILRYKIVKYPIYKKPICSAFLEGMLINECFYTYSFSKSCLMLYSAGSIYRHYIGTKPSHYYFKGNIFYFLEHGILYKINFGEKGKNMMKGELTNAYIDSGRSFYVSDTDITYKYQNHSDSLNCEDVSCIFAFDDLCTVGTLDGYFRIIKIINNQLWQVAEHKSMHRIMDLIVTNDKNGPTVYCSDSFGVLKILRFVDGSLQCKASKSFGILFTSLALYEDSIIAGTADGDILTLSMDLELISNEHVHLASVTKILAFTSQESDYIASGSDDYRLIIFNTETKHRQEFEMPSRVIDILYIHSTCVLACLTTDRTVTIIDCEQNKILSAKKVKIYNPCKLAFDNELIVVGQGIDRNKI